MHHKNSICGINISCLHYNSLVQFNSYPNILITVNAEAIVRAQKDERLRKIINSNLSSIDGQIPFWLFKKKYPHSDIEKISGSDLIYSIPKYASENNLKVFLLGGKEESNAGAIKKLKELYPKLDIKGYSPPFYPYPFPENISKEINEKLIKFQPDILFVGFGMGKQEYWEDDNLDFLNQIGTKLIIGCGGSFEFASGAIKRAPKIIQNMGLEGIWRLLKEFKWFRLKRLLLSSKIFYYYLKEK